MIGHIFKDASETMSNSSMDYVHMDTVTTISTPQEEESDYLDISDDYQDYSGERLFGLFYLCANNV